MDPVKRAFLKTPVGYLEINGSGKGIHTLTFLDFRVRVTRTPAVLKEAVTQLKEYFKGSRNTFSIKLDLKGTPFQIKVWEELLKIPYGTTITYQQLARRIGDNKALRAVGGANSTNPVSVIVPCHRIVGSDGKLVGYAGGLWRKKWLLEHEHAFAQRDLFYAKV
jgi:methylated-DNA-[protein]-cysteine S-methyltransferase